MMTKLYYVICLLACLTLAYANQTGWVILHSIFPGHYEHREASTQHK